MVGLLERFLKVQEDCGSFGSSGDGAADMADESGGGVGGGERWFKTVDTRMERSGRILKAGEDETFHDFGETGKERDRSIGVLLAGLRDRDDGSLFPGRRELVLCERFVEEREYDGVKSRWQVFEHGEGDGVLAR